MKRYLIFIWIGLLIFIMILSGNKTNAAAEEFGKWTPPDGTAWQKTEKGYSAQNGAQGDKFLISDLYVDGTKSFIYECDVSYKGNAAGIVFGAADKKKPSSSWYCMNIQKQQKNSRAFFVRGALAWNVENGLSDEIINRSINKLRVVFTAHESISFFVDELYIGSYSAKDFAGGYLGVMTCYADAEFTNIKYTEFKADTIENIEFLNAEFDSEYNAEKIEYLSYVDYETKELCINMTFGENADVSVSAEGGFSKTAVSDEICRVPLQIGYNCIKVNKTTTVANDIKAESVIYLNVHRSQQASLLYNEWYRPQLHYSSEKEWINDPNGLMYNAATKEYHMFYQTRPRTSALNANQCWYHAVSKDLIHWEQIAPALEPDNLGFCWSGSGGIDIHNTSGFFDEDSDPNGRMVIVYSSVYGDTFYGVEKISLAYSKDNGATWIKYKGNPIIKNGENHVQKYNDGFRDPKLIWYEDDSYKNGGIWLMLVGGGQGRLFSSENLIDWTYQSALTGVGGSALHGECPDFFKIEVDNEPGVYKWVYVSGQLDLNVNPNIFQTSAVVGRLEKNSKGKFFFVAEQDLKQVFYGGNTMYATQSFAFCNRHIQISWLREFRDITGFNIPDAEVKNWNGLMSWPLELKLYNENGKYIFKSFPIDEMTSLREKNIYSGADISISPSSANILSGVSGKFCEIVTKVDVSESSEIVFNLRSGKSGSVKVICSDYNPDDSTVKVTADAASCGKYAGNTASVVTSAENGIVSLRIVADANCIDVFCNEGENSVFALAYPEPDNKGMSVESLGGSARIISMDIYELSSIWENKQYDGDINKGFNAVNAVLYGAIAILLIVLGTFAAYGIKLIRKKK